SHIVRGFWGTVLAGFGIALWWNMTLLFSTSFVLMFVFAMLMPLLLSPGSLPIGDISLKSYFQLLREDWAGRAKESFISKKDLKAEAKEVLKDDSNGFDENDMYEKLIENNWLESVNNDRGRLIIKDLETLRDEMKRALGENFAVVWSLASRGDGNYQFITKEALEKKAKDILKHKSVDFNANAVFRVLRENNWLEVLGTDRGRVTIQRLESLREDMRRVFKDKDLEVVFSAVTNAIANPQVLIPAQGARPFIKEQITSGWKQNDAHRWLNLTLQYIISTIVWGVFFAIPLATLVSAVIHAWPRIDTVEI
ncbi:MAG: hypothetical protein KAI84_01750, partial [Gammaproteobacteria bacterium]|nr:hypothetical protein [Gammaproteobacteria bacterium]